MVSSTAPRLEARCPPLAATSFTMVSRISAARVFSCSMERPRKSAGEWMFSSMSSVNPGNDVIGDQFQRIALEGELAQFQLGFLDQFPRPVLRGRDADHGRIGRLALGQVGTRVLAEGLGGLLQV